ncbi:MAG: sugar phosphate isomerase/epimerase [Spirochaetaceae bacterium]|jgi:L-ribulose-5-phosphate 3-epimerase|nr:sugar phosphate isomerase/epimerase [Spirochaetaceae bacterium]
MKIIETDINWGFRAHDIGRYSAKDLSEKIAAKGFHNIQLALQKALIGIDATYGSLSPGMGRKIGGEFLKQDIAISILGCYINPVHPDREIRKNHLDRFIEHLKYCRDFGCSVVGTETGSVEGFSREETFLDFISSLKILVEAAEKTGTIVAIEGVADKDSIHSFEKMKRALDLIPSPNLGVIYDPVNFLPYKRVHESDDLLKEAFELFGDKMVAIHAKDYILEKDGLNTMIPSGKGSLNYPLLLDLIRSYKPMIPVLLENNTPETLDETISFINRISKV